MWERFAEWEKWSVSEIKTYDVKKESSSEVRINSKYMSSYSRYRNYKIDNVGNFIGVESNFYYGSWLIDYYKSNRAFNYGRVDTTGDDDVYYGYWYTTYVKSSKKEKDELVEMVSAPQGTYPDNGLQGNYWYVKKK